MIWQDELMKTLIAWHKAGEEGMLEPKRKCKRDKKHKVEKRGGSAADIKFQPRRVTQTLPQTKPDETR